MGLEDVLKEGAVGASHKGNVNAGGRVLCGAEESYVEGDVDAKGTVLWDAKESYVKGNVDAKGAVLLDAKESYVEGNVKSEEDVLLGAKESYVEGNVDAKGAVLQCAEESYVEGNVDAKGYVLLEAEESYVEGDVDAGEEVLWDAKESYVKGNVKSKGAVLLDAKESYVEGNVESEGTILFRAKESYVLSDKLKSLSVGEAAKGGMAAAREIETKETGKGLTILTQSDIAGAVKYAGGWKELSDYVSEQLKKENFGDLEPLALFKIEKKEIDFKGLKKELAELHRTCNEVRGSFEDYAYLEEILQLESIWEKSNAQKIKYLRGLDAEITNKLKSRFKANSKTAKRIKNNSNRKELIEALSGMDFAGETGMSIDDFFGKFDGGDGENYEKTYNISLKAEASGKDTEEINKRLYQNGLELLNEIKTGKASIDMSDDADVRDYVSKISALGKRISELMKSGKKGEAQRLISEKRTLDDELSGLKQKKASKMLGEYNTSSITGLKECLSQLSQHYLGGKAKDRASYISKELVVKESELGDNVLKVHVWDKNVSDMPTYDEYRCCAFLGHGQGGIFGYMASNAIDLLRFDISGKSAIAICAGTKDREGRQVLLVDSVESGSHILGRKDVSKAIAGAIEDYAREKGFDEIVYHRGGNNAPQEFYDALDYKEASERKLKLIDSKNVYLEADLGSVKGKVKVLEGS